MRLIDADAFLENEIKEFHCVPILGTTDLNGVVCDYDSLRNALNQQPTVDAKVVVFCGECAHMMLNGTCARFADETLVKLSPNDYCSYGIKKGSDYSGQKKGAT